MYDVQYTVKARQCASHASHVSHMERLTTDSMSVTHDYSHKYSALNSRMTVTKLALNSRLQQSAIDCNSYSEQIALLPYLELKIVAFPMFSPAFHLGR